MAVHKNQGWRRLTPAPNARFGDKARNRQPPTTYKGIQKRLLQAGRGCAAPRTEKTLQTDGRARRSRGRPSSPGPSEQLRMPGGSLEPNSQRRARAASRGGGRLCSPHAPERRWRRGGGGTAPQSEPAVHDPQRSRRRPPRGLTQRCSAARRPLQGTPRRPPPPPARPRSPRPPPRHATSYLQVTCFVQPPPLPSLPPPPPPAPGDRAATVGIGVREAAATAAAAAPAPDVVAVVPGAAASAITVYPTQQWPRNFRDHIVPVRQRG